MIHQLIKRLNVPCPPMLEEALDYPGNARYVAFYEAPNGEMRYDDGTISADGDWLAWLIFVNHPCIAPMLRGPHFHASAQGARRWLLLDREARALYVGEREEINRLLYSQSPGDLPFGLSREEMEALVERVRETFKRECQPLSLVELHEAMAQRNQLLVDLRVWLDAFLSEGLRDLSCEEASLEG